MLLAWTHCRSSLPLRGGRLSLSLSTTVAACLAVLLGPASALAANSWTTTPSMKEQHSAHTATLLEDGTVLVAGGATKMTELYNPVANTWSYTVPTSVGPGAVYTHPFGAAVRLATGKVLLTGGYNSPSGDVTAETYDVVSRWYGGVPSMPRAHVFHTATLTASGKAAVIGGWVSSGSGAPSAAVDLYNPATNSWSTGNPMSLGRGFHTATLLQNGKILVAGGQANDSTGTASAQLYDPAANTWSAVPSMANARFYHQATLLASGKVLVTGGRTANAGTNLSSTELYDPVANSWSAGSAMITGRYIHTATLLPSGKVLVVGGISASNATLSSAEVYDPAAGTWSPTASLGTARRSAQAVALADGRVLVAGGVGDSNLSSAEVYLEGKPPTAVITAPASGQVFPLGSVRTAAFTCTAFTSTLTSCSATVTPPSGPLVTGLTNGSNLPTALAGTYAMTLTARDADGLTGTATRTYVVAAPPTATISVPSSGQTVALDSTLTASFTCASAGSTIASCAATVTPPSGPVVTGLASGSGLPTAVAGTYAMTVTATDSAGLTGTATRTYLAAERPTAFIAIPSSGQTVALDSTLAASFSCASAGSTITGCAATVTPPSGSVVTGLTSGSDLPTAVAGTYEMTVKATDAAGLTGTSTRTYVVAERPTASIAVPSSGQTFALDSTVAASFSCASAALTLASCVATVTPPSGPEVTELMSGDDLPTEAVGTYAMTVTATDSAGLTRTATRTYVVDARPTASIAVPSSGQTFALDSTVAASFSCASTGSTIASCAATVAPPSGPEVTGLTSGDDLPTGVAGAYTMTVTATDARDVTGTATATYVVGERPTASIAAPSSGQTVGLDSAVAASFACASAGSTIASCAATVTPPSGSLVTGLTSGDDLPTGVAGTYTIELTATDAVGLTGTATSTYVVAAPPTASIAVPSSGQTVALDSTVAASFSCASAGSTITSCAATVTPPSGPAIALSNGDDIPTDAAGIYTMTVTTTDAIGQTGAATSTYEATNGPAVAIIAPANGAILAIDSTHDASFSCTPAASAIVSCSAMVAPPLGLSVELLDGDPVPTAQAGTHTITLTSQDALGQTSTATRTYVVAPPPTVTIAVPAPAAVLALDSGTAVSYGCASAGSTIDSCAATVTRSGSPTFSLELSSGGDLPAWVADTYTLTVTARDSVEQTSTLTRTYVVVAPPTATITSPVDGVVLATGATAVAVYSCASAASTVVTCAATVTPPGGSRSTLPARATCHRRYRARTRSR